MHSEKWQQFVEGPNVVLTTLGSGRYGGHNSDMLRRPGYPLGKEDSWMAMRIERTEGHYEAQETSYGEADVCDARSASCWSVSVGKA